MSIHFPELGNKFKTKMTKLKSLAYFVMFFMLQQIVHSDDENEDRCVPDHSNDEDREHVNDWVVHVPKGRFLLLH